MGPAERAKQRCMTAVSTTKSPAKTHPLRVADSARLLSREGVGKLVIEL